MSQIHFFQRYSTPENTYTNNTLLLIGRIYEYSPIQAGKLLNQLVGDKFDDELNIGLLISQQNRTSNSIPDGLIQQRSFKIIIETKKDSSVDEGQLIKHLSSFGNERLSILLLITKNELSKNEKKSITTKVKKENPKIIFNSITFEEICDIIKSQFQEYEYEIINLVEDYVNYCNDSGLIDDSKYLMRIVPCNKSISLNKKYGIYYHPSDRGYKKHTFLGVYANKRVQTIWEIESIFDVKFDGKSLIKQCVQGFDTNKYDDKIIGIINDARSEIDQDISVDHRFFCGLPQKTNYRKTSKWGIQGARYMNLKKVIDKSASVEDLANKLKNETWE